MPGTLLASTFAAPDQASVSAEVVEFERFLTPSAEEGAGRAAAVQRIAVVVQSIWPSATVQVFGSFATGPYALSCLAPSH